MPSSFPLSSLTSCSLIAGNPLTVNPPFPIAGPLLTTSAHGMNQLPDLFELILTCIVPDLGYAVGDQVSHYPFVADVAGYATLSSDAQNLYLVTGTILPQLMNKTTAVKTNITASSWRLDVYPYAVAAPSTPLPVYGIGKLVIGDPGTENTGINVNAVTYESTLKVSDIDGTNYAQTILHRHSTALEPLILGARTNSNTVSHVPVAAGQNLFTIYAAGTPEFTSQYQLAAALSLSVDAGTIGATSLPGKITFSVSKDGTVVPVPAVVVSNDLSSTFSGAIVSTATGQTGGVQVGKTSPTRGATINASSGASASYNGLFLSSNGNGSGDTGVQFNTALPSWRMAVGCGSLEWPGVGDVFAVGRVAPGGVYTSPTVHLALSTTGLSLGAGFGCNAKTPQSSYASGGALNAYAAGANGLSAATDVQALVNLVIAIRQALVNNGIMS
jgi:hypothetical protein